MNTRIINLASGEQVAARVTRCETGWTRMRGMLGRVRLAEDEAYWIHPCDAIHTFFMLVTIDVAFLDADMRILKLIPDMTPFRLCLPVRNAVSVLEGPVGMIERAGLKKGSQLAFDPDGNTGV